MRSLSQLRLLLSQPEVTSLQLFSLSETKVHPKDAEDLLHSLGNPPALQVLPPVFHPIHARKHPLLLLSVLARRLWHGTPYVLGKWYAGSVERALAAALSPRTQIIYVDHVGMAVYLPLVKQHCPKARVVLGCHNIESEFFVQFAQTLRGPLRFIAQQEAKAAARHEAEVLAQVDQAITISKRDAQELRTLLRQHTGRFVQPICVPQVVEPSPVSAARGPACRVVYVGNLTWQPNVEGLSWFCQTVWPLVRARLPLATFRIAGSGLSSHDRVPDAWTGPGIELVGYVDDLAAFAKQADVWVAPVSGGSGVRIKLLDSLRLGVPTVTTQDGAKGLSVRSGRELFVEDHPDAFARAIVRLWEEPDLAQRLREAGLSYLCTHHSPKTAHQALRLALSLP